MQETTIERDMINITEAINFKEAELLLKQLEAVEIEIEEIVSRKFEMEGLI